MSYVDIGIQEVVAAIDAKIAELRAETAKYEEALFALRKIAGPGTWPAQALRPATAAAHKSNACNGGGDEHRAPEHSNKVVEKARALGRPFNVKEIADMCGMTYSAAYSALLRECHIGGDIEKRGRGWYAYAGKTETPKDVNSRPLFDDADEETPLSEMSKEQLERKLTVAAMDLSKAQRDGNVQLAQILQDKVHKINGLLAVSSAYDHEPKGKK